MKDAIILYLVLVPMMILNTPIIGTTDECNEWRRTLRATNLYDRAPAFHTGSGWRLGKVIDEIPANSKIQICDSKELGLIFDKKKWYRVKYGNIDGWVFSYDIQALLHPNHDFEVAVFDISFVSVAHAQVTSEGEAAPLPSSAAGLSFFYILMFALTLLGMIGKVIFDEIDRDQFDVKTSLDRNSIIRCCNLKKCIKAIIVAPIIFSGLLNTADFQANVGVSGFIATILFAFQNGFFWQTVLPSSSKNSGHTVIRQLNV